MPVIGDALANAVQQAHQCDDRACDGVPFGACKGGCISPNGARSTCVAWPPACVALTDRAMTLAAAHQCR